MTLLGEGIVKIRRGGETTRLNVAGGFLQVAANVVRIVAGRADAAPQG
jgi:F0F1-type ATP synthase epsilon subunit